MAEAAETEATEHPWMSPEKTEINGRDLTITVLTVGDDRHERGGLAASQSNETTSNVSDGKLGLGERAFSAAGAAFLSAIIVNPLDVAKMFADLRCSPSCTRAGVHGTVSMCPPDCFQYRGTLDVFYKIIRQEGFSRLWRGTNAGLALAVPTVGIYLPCYDVFRNWLEEATDKNAPSATPYVPLVAGSLARSLACATCYPIELARTRMQAFKGNQIGKKPPGVWQTLLGVLSHVKSTNNIQKVQGYRILWTGMGTQLARDVPFSAICWSTLEPMRRRLLSFVGEDSNAASVLGANFSAAFVAGSLAAAATCPLDVAKTRRQIEKDPGRAMRMTTRQTLMEVWREAGIKGLFTGVGPRVARAGPSVGIVVSFYEVVKYVLHNR
ncbi:mitochondrial carrier protein MTM1 [Citrus sinensis]|nr:mitochondrial carrier protein MTM1 [Citrus sinensis]